MNSFPAFRRWLAITTSDTVNFVPRSSDPYPDAIYVGTAGNVVLVFQDDSTLTIPAAASTYLWCNGVKRVNATSTTASNLVALYAQ